MQLILFIISAMIFIYLAIMVLKFSKNLFLFSFGVIFLVLFGCQILLGYLFEIIGRVLKIRRFFVWIICFASMIAFFGWGIVGFNKIYEIYTFSSLKFGLSAILFYIIAYQCNFSKSLKDKVFDLALVNKKEINLYIVTFTSFCILVTSVCLYLIFEYFNLNSTYLFYTELFFFISSVLLQIYVILSISEIKKIFLRLDEKMLDIDAIVYSELLSIIAEDISVIEKDEIDLLIRNYLGKLIWNNEYVEINIIDDSWVIRTNLYNEAYEDLILELESKDKITDSQLLDIVKDYLPFSDNKNASFYVDSYLSEIGQYNVDNATQKYFSLFKKDNYRVCSSCGVIEYISFTNDEEWFCSDICKDTEKNCLEIKEKPFNKFVEESTISGFMLMNGAKANNLNYKITTQLNKKTSHGFAAERANDYLDKMSGKKAKILGDNNAKNGPDRLVNGKLIQTKYYESARGSVDACFDKNTKLMRYLNPDGSPMQIEVPKDQYEKAIERMSQKIREGKVPGVTNPNEAKNLIRKGNITYNQAKNITKFGTFESITFDIVDGAVVSFSAAGISFGITLVIHYLNSNDKEKAIQAATLQAGKTFATSLIVYVSAQQLQRIETVFNVVNHIDLNHLPKSLQQIFKIGDIDKANKLFKGSIVTSAVLIAVSSGPDFLKMLRGRISGAQFLHNTAVISSGVAGGGIGTVVGGLLGTPLGPIGIVGGQFLGGMAGGMISSFVANKYLGNLRESDQEKMMKIIQIQFEYLAKLFMMRKEEIDNISLNLSKYLTQEVLETMYSQKAENRISFANFILKPIFVAVVKQRETVTINDNDIVKALEFKSA